MSVDLSPGNHCPLLMGCAEFEQEALSYREDMQMTYGFVADALTGERLNVLQQCCELTVRSDRVAWPSHKTKSIPQPSERFLGKHLGHACLVVGGPASGKSILTRRVVAEALRRREKLLPILIP